MLQKLKRTLFQLIPPSVQYKIKEKHYLKKLKTYPEEWETDIAMVRKIIKPGDLVVDIGANFGLYSKAMAEATGSGGKVYSFEPIPQMRRILQNSLNVLGLNNVLLEELAMSNSEGTTELVIPVGENGLENMYEAHIGGDGSGLKLSIKTTTLDNYFFHRKIIPSFIKVDVEGHELEVMEGAQKLLQESSPVLLLEVNHDPESHEKSAKLFSLLKGLNYQPFVFNGNDLVEWKTGERSLNYFFVKAQN